MDESLQNEIDIGWKRQTDRAQGMVIHFEGVASGVEVVAAQANRIWIVVQWMPRECKKSGLIVAGPLIARASCSVSRPPDSENASRVS